MVLHVHSKSSPEDRGTAIIDIFRVENGKIVEHWDVLQPVPEKAAAPTPARRLDLTAQTTEGPFYLAGMPMRADITEGLPGVPMAVHLRVVDAGGSAQPGCRVDLWQCDAQGLYSGFDGQGDDRSVSRVGKAFLRGSQVTGADGDVAFLALYPGG